MENWLWDRKIKEAQVKKILKDPRHPKFISYAGLLLSRSNSPREVFSRYLNKINFCQNWIRIKKQMNKDAWASPRIYYWQAIYEKVALRLKEEGISIKSKEEFSRPDESCKNIGQQIAKFRKEKGLTQRELAKKLKISQQMISHIEKGRQNISILTLTSILKNLNAGIEIKGKI